MDRTTNVDEQFLTSLASLGRPLKKSQDVFVFVDKNQYWAQGKIISSNLVQTSDDTKPRLCIKVKLADDQNYVQSNEFMIALTNQFGTSLAMTKRVIAGPDRDHLKPGIIADTPCSFNNNRYLILMDDTSAIYAAPEHVYPIVHQSLAPWNDSTDNSQLSIQCFFTYWPRKDLVKVSKGDTVHLSRRGIIVRAEVINVDCEIVNVKYKDETSENIYRGSPRFQFRHIVMERLTKGCKKDVYHSRLDDYRTAYNKATKKLFESLHIKKTPRKSTSASCANDESHNKIVALPVDRHTSKAHDHMDIFELSPEEIALMRGHKCDSQCLAIDGMMKEREISSMDIEFSDVSDLQVPILLGWTRHLTRDYKSKGKKLTVAYEAPCGKRYYNLNSLQCCLRDTNSRLDIDYFCFDRDFRLNRAAPIDQPKAFYYSANIALDKLTSEPLERKSISIINCIDNETISEEFTYVPSIRLHPSLEDQGFSRNEDFKSGCDCDGDCRDRVDCPCHQLNHIAASSDKFQGGMIDKECNYTYKRLMNQVVTGIFECNSNCSCSSKCPNRVVQNGIRLRLQIQKTESKGWGLFALDDIPKGAFISIYSGELLDNVSDLESDTYLADLDYISTNQANKEVFDDSDQDEGFTADERLSELSSSSSDDDYVDIEQRDEIPAKFKDIHELLDSDDFTIDSKLIGNVSRFMNHSCEPNAFPQNVFIETHDPRLPVVAFFAKRNIKSMEEITWNYNYQIDGIPGRHITCNCKSINCLGRIL